MAINVPSDNKAKAAKKRGQLCRIGSMQAHTVLFLTASETIPKTGVSNGAPVLGKNAIPMGKKKLTAETVS